ncbi:MAG: diaminopimelate epimerase [Chloroflexota bacterium]
MHFTKLQATGNDFILLETADEARDWPPLATAMCHRHFGIGSDGLLLLMPSRRADFRMRMFNPDGSEAEACGNGLRCVVRYIIDKERVKSGAPEMMIETAAGLRPVRLRRQGKAVNKIQVGMGTPRFRAEAIPVALESAAGEVVDITPMLGYTATVAGRELKLNLVSMGNPHAVYYGPGPVADFPITELGPLVEHLAVFPERTNFEVVRVLSRREVEARVWERGAGETLSCGSGACALAVAGQQLGLLDNSVAVRLPGGTLEVQWDRVGEVFLSGPAETVFTGEWPD